MTVLRYENCVVISTRPPQQPILHDSAKAARCERTTMAATDIGARNVSPAHADDLDDLFDYDVGDVFRDVDTNMDISTSERTIARTEGKENGAGLGIDEEIKVTKKRAPVPKLDENRSASYLF